MGVEYGARLALVFTVALTIVCAPARAAVPASFSFPVARAPHPLPLDPTLADPGVGGGPSSRTGAVAERHDAAAIPLSNDGLPALRRQESLRRLQSRAGRRSDRGVADDQRRRIRTRRLRRHRSRHERRRKPSLLLRNDAARHPLRTSERERSLSPALDARRGASGTGSWSAMLIIPLDVLRVPHGGKQTWRLQFVRGIAARARAPLVGVGFDHGGFRERNLADVSRHAILGRRPVRSRRLRGHASQTARRYLRLGQRRRGSQPLPASQRHVLADERALVRRRRQLSDHADDSLSSERSIPIFPTSRSISRRSHRKSSSDSSSSTGRSSHRARHSSTPPPGRARRPDRRRRRRTSSSTRHRSARSTVARRWREPSATIRASAR